MERPEFANEEIYHVYNRGVEKRNVFMNYKDHLRFIHDMYEFNDENPALNLGHRLSKSDFNTRDILKSDFDMLRKPRKPLVDILCFCLMPNHYHFLLRQLVDGGITEFMRKIGTGYTNYFNLKYDRVGPLFQGKFKAVHVTEESHLLYLPQYIHLNPLDLAMPEWREQRIRNPEKALEFLQTYRWSSYLDYIGKKNFPHIISPDHLSFIYGNSASPARYKQEMKEWLDEFNFDRIRDVMLDC